MISALIVVDNTHREKQKNKTQYHLKSWSIIFMNHGSINNVFNVSMRPRITLDNISRHVNYWGSNRVLTNTVSKVFVHMRREYQYERIENIAVYPVMYMLSKEEKELIKNSAEFDDNHILSGFLIEFYAKRTDAPNLDMCQLDDIYDITYSIYVDQTMNINDPTGVLTTGIMLNSALNYLRNIMYLPHDDVNIDIHIPQVNGYGTAEDITLPLIEGCLIYGGKGEALDKIIKHLKKEGSLRKFNEKNMTAVFDSHSKKDWPFVYRQIMDTYKKSILSCRKIKIMNDIGFEEDDDD